MIEEFYKTKKFKGANCLSESLRRAGSDDVKEIGKAPLYRDTRVQDIYVINGSPVIHLCRNLPEDAEYDFQIISADNTTLTRTRRELSKLLNEELVKVLR